MPLPAVSLASTSTVTTEPARTVAVVGEQVGGGMSATVIETVAGADGPNASAAVNVKLSGPTKPAVAV